MAILKIARMGHPLLMGIAKKVNDPCSPSVQQLVSDMVDTMLDAPGVGLAAPQVHVPARIVVYHLPADREGLGEGVPLTVLINPEIEALSQQKEDGIEGCLSLPEMAGVVPRYTNIRYRAYNLEGKWVEAEVEGYHARIIQHECDHLDGILYPMRMTDLSKLGYTNEMSKLEARSQADSSRPDKEKTND